MTGVAGLAAARTVADTVLYEGYVLFPYRASAAKNRYRWQFGVVIPAAQQAAGTGEPSEVRSDCLLRADDDARIVVTARALRVRQRTVEQAVPGGFEPVETLRADGILATAWDEGVETEVVAGPVRLDDLLDRPHHHALELTGTSTTEDLVDAAGTAVGRLVRRLQPLTGTLDVAAERLDRDTVRLVTTVRNTTDWADAGASREDVLRRSLVGCHLLLGADGGAFASLQDPPPWAAAWVGALDNRHTFPVLAGPTGSDDLILSAPIILPDHPAVAAESPGDAFDATEIDELLTLSVRALPEAERLEALATDPRAADVIERAAGLPPAVLERLHGAVRQFQPARQTDLDDDMATFFGVGEAPLQQLAEAGRVIAVGDRVRLCPSRRADAQDLFLGGQAAVVQRIERDVDGDHHVGVTLEADPAADLDVWSGRLRYFRPDEIEPLDEP